VTGSVQILEADKVIRFHHFTGGTRIRAEQKMCWMKMKLFGDICRMKAHSLVKNVVLLGMAEVSQPRGRPVRRCIYGIVEWTDLAACA